MRNFDALSRLRQLLEREPSLPIERAAEALRMSVRNLYRRRNEFEYLRKGGHLYFTVRSLRTYIELEQYNATALHDLTKDADSCAGQQSQQESERKA